MPLSHNTLLDTASIISEIQNIVYTYIYRHTPGVSVIYRAEPTLNPCLGLKRASKNAARRHKNFAALRTKVS